MLPATQRGRSGVAYSSASRRASAAAATFSSRARSARPYSASTTENAPKVSVSMTSTPTSRNDRCSRSTASGFDYQDLVAPLQVRTAEVLGGQLLQLQV